MELYQIQKGFKKYYIILILTQEALREFIVNLVSIL